jgi:hypothetical protein
VEDLVFSAGPLTVLFGKNNAGKTNVLETIYGALAPDDRNAIRRTPSERPSKPTAVVLVDLEVGIPFDDAVAEAVQKAGDTQPRRAAFANDGVFAGDAFEEGGTDDVDPREWLDDAPGAPRLHPLLLDWSYSDVHTRVEAAIATLASTEALRMRRDGPWLEMTSTTEEQYAYRVPPRTQARVAQLSSLATDLLPDFVDGSIDAHVTVPTIWDSTPKVLLEYSQRGATQCADSVDAAGHGAARWMAAAVQIALHLMTEHEDLMTLRDLGPRAYSGHVLLVDEPEAHLHPAAVASMVRWCDRMVSYGFNVVVASHHEEFLRADGPGVTLVHVTRDADLVTTSARALPTKSVSRLRELADDIGLHPATALSLHRAVLFVEGPLDEAVLDEYGGLRLDAAGVKILPIHGTKNLEGLVATEVVTELGLKIGILTDATVTATMSDRSGKKRSSEERKVLRVMQLAADKGLPPPTPFGVAEDDLLFALPTEALRDFLRGPFPEWKALVAECRASLGADPSQSVDWKKHALDQYGLPITSPSGVREIVRHLDLSGVVLPSIEQVVDDVVSWLRC